MVPRYELGPSLLADGAGTLHVAHDRHLDRTVDVKVLRGRRPERERRRLEREARLLGAAQHPGLPLLLDARLGDDAFLVFRHVSTRTLAEEVRQRPPSRSKSLAWARQLAACLHAAHAQGVIHSDLRPDVVLVSPEGALVVHGFGRARSDAPSERRSTAEETLDYPVFNAPEVLRGGDVDVRTDVFGIVQLLRFLLTGAPPVDVSGARSPAEAFERIVAAPRVRVEGVSPLLAEMLEAGSAVERSQRPSSMLDVLERLAREQHGESSAPCSAAEESGFFPGDVVAGFEIRSELGRGGFGRVYLAHDPRLARDVALKHFHDTRARPEHEGRALARVRHPNVVHVYELVEHEGRALLVHEHVPGESLDRRLSAGAPPTVSVVGAVLDQILAGLVAIHDADIVHGDLKPANVVVDANWNAKLIDFGLAVRSEESGPAPGALTPAYAAPEVVRHAVRSPRSDLYSFGILAFELATGRLPFACANVAEMLRAHATTPAPRLSTVAPAFAPLDALVAACLAKDPAERPRDARDARARLARALRSSTILRRPKRVLVVDDDELMAESLVDAITPFLAGGVAVTARDGETAIALGLEEHFDLVLLDLRLPRRSGLEVLAELRAGALTLPPVVIVSGEASSHDWRLLVSMGAQAILVKPFDPLLFEATARRFLSDDVSVDDRG